MSSVPKILIPLAPGVEETEMVTCVDVLRRAGFDVIVAGLQLGVVKASRGVLLAADALLEDVLEASYDLILIPGGMGGVHALLEETALHARLQRQANEGGWLASICAGPLVLQKAGLLDGRRYTSHPSVKNDLTAGEWVDEAVVTDGRLVTSQGPGTAMVFALALIEILGGPELRDEVQGPLCCCQ